jgi:hypothetical protein
MSSSSFRRLTMHGCAFAASVVLLGVSRVEAQVTETPVTFDSSGRVPAITPALAERLRLGRPAWPVTGEFERARLFRTSDGAYVLVVERRTKSLDRYTLSETQAAELRLAVQAPLRAGARAGLGEQTDVASEPAGNAFARHQALLGLFIYGPTAAGALTEDAALGTATSLIVGGGTFFAAMMRRQANPPITTAQNNLSTWAALDGGALGGALAYVAGVDDGHAASGAVFLGSVGGTLAGLGFGKRMTDAEAAASSFGGNALAATSIGVMGVTGALDAGDDGKAQVALASTALVAGYAVGPMYPRRAGYTVTAGDVNALFWTSLLGVATAYIPFADESSHDSKTLSAALTTGLVGGIVLGDRLLARPYDHTRSEAWLLASGMGAGALIGGGLAAGSSASEQTAYSMGVAGAILGAVATEGFFRSSPRSLGYRSPVRSEGGTRRVGVSVNPMGLAFAAGRRPGRFSIVRVTF